ncbi:MAG: hypothetical protein QGG84_08020, partial [Rhodospirillales bacterium]|nr:hypothetical protein [Rhodospirillales bacterium]
MPTLLPSRRVETNHLILKGSPSWLPFFVLFQAINAFSKFFSVKSRPAAGFAIDLLAVMSKDGYSTKEVAKLLH